MKKAFITGITGQDGSFLTEFLLKKGYEVHGMIRRASNFNTNRIDHLMDNSRLKLYHGDMTDSSNLNKLLNQVKPTEIYNLAAQSHVKVSFEVPEYTAQVDAIGPLRLLDAMLNHCPEARFFQASTSELYGLTTTCPQDENTAFHPRSPYAAAKVYAYWIVRNYRDACQLYATNGIMFNHESERRGKTFVTRKITIGLCEVREGLRDCLRLGNLDAVRDWGYAKEYVEGMWLMLQQEQAGDFVLATGQKHSVREFVELVAKELGMELVWEGKGLGEKGIDKGSGKVLVEIDPNYFRPAEVPLLQGNATKAATILGWKPKVMLPELVRIMVRHDLNATQKRKIHG